MTTRGKKYRDTKSRRARPLLPTGPCPRPDKEWFQSKGAAKAAIRRRQLAAESGARDAIKPYRCTCGRWHLGHTSRRHHGGEPPPPP